MQMTTRLRELIERPQIGWKAAVYDGLTTKLACEAGFDALTIAGFQVAAAMGLPDAELYTMSENLSATRYIVNASTVPVIADCDTGYGNAINVMRTVQEFERAGVAGLILEDQVSPKRCPAMADPEILPFDEAVGKIRAAVAARVDPNLVIIARTDAIDVDEACRRARAFADAGADMILTINRCCQSYEDLCKVRDAAGIPLNVNVMGWVEQLSIEQLTSVASLAGSAFTTLLTVVEALRQNFAALQRDKSPKNLPIPVANLGKFKTFIGFPEIERLTQLYIPGN